MDQPKHLQPDTKIQLLSAWCRRLVAPSQERQLQTNLKKMRHPIFALMALGMESRFPTSSSFGKFRQGRTHETDAKKECGQTVE